MTRLYILLILIFLMGCGFEIGNSSSEDQDNDIITTDNSGQTTESSAKLCEGTQSVDGPEGFLWKPESESTGKLVVLFPKEYDKQFLAVAAILPNGDIEDGTFTGFTNGDRQTWRFSKHGSRYAGRLIVDAGSQECEWIVEDPSELQD